jgi:hypothetical protein
VKQFSTKISYQRKILTAVNECFPVDEQLPGLTTGTIDCWLKNRQFDSKDVITDMLLEASKLTASLDDFSAPMPVNLEATKEEIEQLSKRIRLVFIQMNRSKRVESGETVYLQR